jgi:hypothetical protein
VLITSPACLAHGRSTSISGPSWCPEREASTCSHLVVSGASICAPIEGWWHAAYRHRQGAQDRPGVGVSGARSKGRQLRRPVPPSGPLHSPRWRQPINLGIGAAPQPEHQHADRSRRVAANGNLRRAVERRRRAVRHRHRHGAADQGLGSGPLHPGSGRAACGGNGRVEDGRGSLGPMANAPFPIPAHRTGRADFRHPACMGLSLSRGITPFLSSFFLLKSDEFSFVFLRRLRFGDGRRPIAV